MRFDTSMESLIGIGRSESFVELNNQTVSSTYSLFSTPGNTRSRQSFSGKSSAEDPLNANLNIGKPFGMGKSPVIKKLQN